MKIVCQSCSAKYSIADDKVQGKKVFKIKCKKCGEDILVRGPDAGAGADLTGSNAPMMTAASEPFPDDEATRVVGGEGGEPVWHAVVNGDQQGPYSVDQIRDMLMQGTIDPETYVWRDGFGDWRPLREVAELANVMGGAPAPAAAPAASGGDALFAAAPAASSGGGLFAAEPAKPSGGGLFGGAAEAKAKTGGRAAAGGDLFGDSSGGKGGVFGAASAGAAAGGEEDDVSTSAAGGSPRVDPKSMTGSRNENSVLFSLASLQQIAGTDKPAKVAEPGAAGKGGASDASGLIDIKSMASSMGGSDAKKKVVDEILTVGGGGLASPLAAPLLAPVATPASVSDEKPQGTNKTVLFAVIAVALILAVGGVAIAMLVTRNQASQNQQQQQQPQTTPPPTVPPAVPQPGTNPALAMNTAAPGGVAIPGAGTAAAPGTAGATGAAPGTDPAPGSAAGATPGSTGGSSASGGSRPSGGSRGSGSSRPSSGSSSSASTASTSTGSSSAGNASTAPPAPSGGSCAQRCRGNIDCLLNCGASAGGSGGGGSRPAPASNVPDAPSRNDVASGLGAVRSAVNACGGGQTGVAMVQVTFASSGRVTTANVQPPFGGTPAGSCIARAVRGASIPPFARPTFQVTFPYSIR